MLVTLGAFDGLSMSFLSGWMIRHGLLSQTIVLIGEYLPTVTRFVKPTPNITGCMRQVLPAVYRRLTMACSSPPQDPTGRVAPLDPAETGSCTPAPAAERTPSVARSATYVGLGTLGSRLVGAVRDSVVAAMFPLAATDAFVVAFTIPNALRVLLGEGAVSAAFVPTFVSVRAKQGETEGQQFVRRLFGAMIVVLSLVTLAGVLLAPYIVPLYAGGYAVEPGKLALTIELTRWVFPFILLMGLAALGAGVLNALGVFFVPALAPALFNLVMIAAPFSLSRVAAATGYNPVVGLAWGALLGGAGHLLIQVPALRARGMIAAPTFDFGDPHVRDAIRRLAPLVVGLGVYQLNIMLSRLFASFLPHGAQSYLYYGQRVVEIPQGMFAMAIASATLPGLSLSEARGTEEHTLALFYSSVRLTLFVAIPASFALMALSEPIIAVLFARGEFGYHEVQQTARSMFWQASGIWAVAAIRATIPMFHSKADTRTPVWASATNLFCFVIVTASLLRSLGHRAIAVGLSAAACVQLAVLWWGLHRRIPSLQAAEVTRPASRMVVASAAMALLVWFSSRLGAWHLGGNHLPNLLGLLALVGVGAASYLGMGLALGMPEARTLTLAIRTRFGRVARTKRTRH